ncbi:UDP-galactose phosphate transferase [Polymorphobacter glacialis]|uniref:UDP-galactose phosphate transferase n=1 Tax=Sandarakinorhabdus glacialis TaxID=1614636 RepID=A0A916ZUA0_9SPHN|nr:sugar transferase [Polymorphobacter glacialis]GGE14516.1 UDP-galactose phosphate transferase [Polymorphobacter glacialis]
MIRRVLDTAAVLVLLPLAVPLALVTAGIVALGLGRPILFRQHRAGRRGSVFLLWKFRTMTPPRSPDRALADDAVRTPAAGRWLRRLRLDELPQLFNVLKGDMALIGPRPLLPSTVAGMGFAGTTRALVRPGLTGWSQVNGNTLLSDAEKLKLDLWYVRNRSPMVDIEIIVRTLGVVALGERRGSLVTEGGHAGNRRRRG